MQKMRKLINRFIKWFAFFFTETYKHRFVSNYPIQVEITILNGMYMAYRKPIYGEKRPYYLAVCDSKEKLIEIVKTKWPFAMIEDLTNAES